MQCKLTGICNFSVIHCLLRSPCLKNELRGTRPSRLKLLELLRLWDRRYEADAWRNRRGPHVRNRTV
jgi:hypothetical protein